jgi:tRNA nucleotidyltransferase (CCA-adding enzyme)
MEDSSSPFEWPIDDETEIVLSRIRKRGKAWIVGGWVRDSLLGVKSNTDIDIATNLRPTEIVKIFPDSIIINENFGTVLVRMKDENIQFFKEWEVTTLRSESNYTDGRRPDLVNFGDSIFEDISRRDFTINAMAINREGDLIDKFGGHDDLKKNTLRCVGNANERLSEDGLRIIRAFRFIGLRDNTIMTFDSELNKAILDNVGMIKKVSKERIDSELRKIMKSRNALRILSKMKDFKVIEIIFPDLKINLDVKLTDDYRVNLLLIFGNDDKNNIEVAKLLKKYLKISNKDESIIRFLSVNKLNIPSNNAGELRRFRTYLSDEQKNCFLKYLEGSGFDANNLKSSLINLPPLKAGKEPLIDGNILRSVTGLEPGAKLGKLKGLLHREQIEQDIGNIEEVLNLLKYIDWENSNYEDWGQMCWP